MISSPFQPQRSIQHSGTIGGPSNAEIDTAAKNATARIDKATPQELLLLLRWVLGISEATEKPSYDLTSDFETAKRKLSDEYPFGTYPEARKAFSNKVRALIIGQLPTHLQDASNKATAHIDPNDPQCYPKIQVALNKWSKQEMDNPSPVPPVSAPNELAELVDQLIGESLPNTVGGVIHALCHLHGIPEASVPGTFTSDYATMKQAFVGKYPGKEADFDRLALEHMLSELPWTIAEDFQKLVAAAKFPEERMYYVKSQLILHGDNKKAVLGFSAHARGFKSDIDRAIGEFMKSNLKNASAVDIWKALGVKWDVPHAQKSAWIYVAGENAKQTFLNSGLSSEWKEKISPLFNEALKKALVDALPESSKEAIEKLKAADVDRTINAHTVWNKEMHRLEQEESAKPDSPIESSPGVSSEIKPSEKPSHHSTRIHTPKKPTATVAWAGTELSTKAVEAAGRVVETLRGVGILNGFATKELVHAASYLFDQHSKLTEQSAFVQAYQREKRNFPKESSEFPKAVQRALWYEMTPVWECQDEFGKILHPSVPYVKKQEMIEAWFFKYGLD